MELTFWGTRGSIPVPGESYAGYGGNTPCLELETKAGEVIIIDAGSGIRNLGNNILRENKSKKLSLIISHTHWDHIQGIPFFKPFYIPGFEIDVYFPASADQKAEDMFDVQMQPLYFPVTRKVFGSKFNFINFTSSSVFNFNGMSVQFAKVHHSKNTMSYKFVENGKTLVYMTDNEIEYGAAQNDPTRENILKNNSDLISFCEGADYLIHDSMYFYSEFKQKIGWGHSNNKSLAIFAGLAKVKNLLLFHYDPEHDDKKVEQLFTETKEFLLREDPSINCIASCEGMKIKI